MPHALSRTETFYKPPLSSTSTSTRSSTSNPQATASKLMLPLLNMEAPPPTTTTQSGKPPQHQLMRTVSISVLVMSLPVLYVSFLHVPPAALFRDTTFWFLMSNSIIIVIAADSGMLFFGRSSSSSADDGGVPFAVVSGGESVAAKNGHASMGVVSNEVAVVQDQALVVTMEHGGDHLPVITADDSYAYALVVREDQGDRAVASAPAAESREIIISPSAAAGEVVAVKNVDIAPAARPRSRLTASRSLAAREERPAATRRRHGHGHGHRPSHSHALVPVQDKSVVVSEEKRLRRAETDRRPSPLPPPELEGNEKESEYSRLSDEELNRRVEEFITKFNREIRLQVEMEQAAAA